MLGPTPRDVFLDDSRQCFRAELAMGNDHVGLAVQTALPLGEYMRVAAANLSA